MGLLKGEYKMELYGMSNIEDLEGFLSVVFNDFCLKNNLPMNESADDILYHNAISKDKERDLTEHQKQWLRQFINLWEENI
jgi:hypothetical protein